MQNNIPKPSSNNGTRSRRNNRSNDAPFGMYLPLQLEYYRYRQWPGLERQESITNFNNYPNAYGLAQATYSNALPAVNYQNYASSWNGPYSFNNRSRSSGNTSSETYLNGSNELRQWQYSSLGYKLKAFPNYGKNKGVVFKLMSYNVLSQKLLENHLGLYRHSNPSNLEWDRRWENLKAEIIHHMAEIICLQEVQESHLDDYVNFFNSIGYKGVFKKRTGTAYPDGCAIFYNTNMFIMVDHHFVEYFKSNSHILNRNNVAIIAKFAPKNKPNKIFIVATTHLLYNPRREDVRLAQVQILLTEIDHFGYDEERNAYLPIILCGDFNSQPSMGVYELITKQQVKYKNYWIPSRNEWIPSEIGITNNCKYLKSALRQYGVSTLVGAENSEQINKLLFESDTLSHEINFKPVYEVGRGVSTHQDEWIAVDYMFYSASSNKSGMKFLQRYQLPTTSSLKSNRIKGIPNDQLGSDHFALLAKFKFEY